MISLRFCFYTLLIFVALSNANAQSEKEVRVVMPEKDKACHGEPDALAAYVVTLPASRKRAWRSSFINKQVQAEGIAWSTLYGQGLVLDGMNISLKGCDFTKDDVGRLVRVNGTLRYESGATSSFGESAPYFFLESDSYTVIERVKNPLLMGINEDDASPIAVEITHMNK